MSLSAEQLAQYCQRINYGDALTPTLATLQALHELHPRAIAFENLTPWLGLPVSLEPQALFDKLVLQQRGGYCFEQNGLFRLVLDAIGFRTTGLSARVLWNQPPDARPPRTHQALLVELNGHEWLADVGFGGLTPLAPLRMTPEQVQGTPLESFRLRQRHDGWMLEAMLPGGARPMYVFQPEPAASADFQQSNWYVATHPESRFLRNLICTTVRGDERHNLVNREHTVYRPGQAPVTRELPDVKSLQALLADLFLLDVSALPTLPAQLRALFKDNHEN